MVSVFRPQKSLQSPIDLILSAHTYWIGKLAPKGWERGLSYWVGALTAAAWYFWTAGTFLLAAEILLAAIETLHPNYKPHPFHAVLLAWMEAIIAVIWNIPAFKSWPHTLKAMIIITNCGILFICISLLVQATPKRTAREVFVDVVNLSGWSSRGVVFFLGLLPGSAAINGFDSAAHMTEEVPNPAKQIPQVMVWNAFLSGLSGLPVAIIFCFCISNVDNLMAPVGGVTIIQIFADSTNSKALFIIASIIYFVVVTVAASAALTTASRVWWALSEHKGMPFHSFFGKVSKTENWTVPANSILVIAFLSCLIVLLELGPSFVISALYSAANVNFYIGYGATIACFLWTKWTKGIPQHYMNLGGIFGNILGVSSVIWCAFVSIWLLFPYFRPVDGKNMNYTLPVVAVVIFVFSFDYFLRGRKQYFIPSPLII